MSPEPARQVPSVHRTCVYSPSAVFGGVTEPVSFSFRSFDGVRIFVGGGVGGFMCSSADVMGPVLKVCGNIASGTQPQTQLVIDAQVLGKLPMVFKAKRSKDEQRRDVCWLISNVMSGPPEHIQVHHASARAARYAASALRIACLQNGLVAGGGGTIWKSRARTKMTLSEILSILSMPTVWTVGVPSRWFSRRRAWMDSEW